MKSSLVGVKKPNIFKLTKAGHYLNLNLLFQSQDRIVVSHSFIVGRKGKVARSWYFSPRITALFAEVFSKRSVLRALIVVGNLPIFRLICSMSTYCVPAFGKLVQRANLRQTLGPARTLTGAPGSTSEFIILLRFLSHCVFTPDFFTGWP